MKDITTRCHSCARPFEMEMDEDAERFTQYERPYFELQNKMVGCPHCGRKHGDGYSMEIVKVPS